jgi:hypothetical protein
MAESRSTKAPDPMQINPPYGFQEIVPLDKKHKVALPKSRTLPPVFRNMNPIPVSFVEFVLVSRDYPLVFITGDGGRTYMPMAVLGLEQQQNLFVLGDNTWDRRVYLPAYVRRYPFCMTRVTVDGQERAERVACVEKSALSEKGDALFNSKGEATPEWEALQKLLFEYEADLSRTEEFCKVLGLLGLFEPFSMQATPAGGGEPLALTGMFRVSEQKLAELEPARLKELTANGILARVYAHLMSLDNFRQLLDRRAAFSKRGAGEKPDKSRLN